MFVKPLDIGAAAIYNVARYRLLVACYIFWEVIVIHCERHLGGYFRAIATALGQDMQQSSEALGLTSTQIMFLHHLWVRQVRHETVTYAKDLEDFFSVKHSTVSGVLQRMEAAGFVSITASETDRRCKLVALTQKGLDAHEQTSRQIRQTEARLVSGMTDSEVAELRRLLDLAARNLGVFPRHPKEELRK